MPRECGLHLSPHPMHRAGADTERLRRFENARAGRQLRPDALNDISTHRTTPKPFSLRSGASKAGIDPTSDHRPLELGECARDLVKQFACRRRGVDGLLFQKQIAPDRLKVLLTGVAIGMVLDAVLGGGARALYVAHSSKNSRFRVFSMPANVWIVDGTVSAVGSSFTVSFGCVSRSLTTHGSSARASRACFEGRIHPGQTCSARQKSVPAPILDGGLVE
jgi:hypothetical protein